MSQLLEVSELKKYFPINKGYFSRSTDSIKAVDGVSFCIDIGETLGLVGESGCGKSTTGRTVMRLLHPTSGEVKFYGRDISNVKGRDEKELRKRMQIIFQDPYGSLNPRMTVGKIIGEALQIHQLATGREKIRRVQSLLEEVGLSSRHMRRFPHEFSGGQRQRIGVARALAVEPELIVCDEPVSALDVSVQAQVLNLLKDLKKKHKLSYLFISHDLGVVRHISDKIGVMYLGKIVELARRDELFSNPLHPYTKALLNAIPVIDPKKRDKEKIILSGDIPSPMNPPTGCRFHTRCPERLDICSKIEPEFIERGNGSIVSCHNV